MKNMEIVVTVLGRFDIDYEGNPDVTKPVHDLNKADGLHLKGKQREFLGKRATEIGIKETYLEQLEHANEDQIRLGNRTSIKTIPVIKVARQEQEKKEQGGRTFYQSILNVYEAQKYDSDKPLRKILDLFWFLSQLCITLCSD